MNDALALACTHSTWQGCCCRGREQGTRQHTQLPFTCWCQQRGLMPRTAPMHIPPRLFTRPPTLGEPARIDMRMSMDEPAPSSSSGACFRSREDGEEAADMEEASSCANPACTSDTRLCAPAPPPPPPVGGMWSAGTTPAALRLQPEEEAASRCCCLSAAAAAASRRAAPASCCCGGQGVASWFCRAYM